MDSMTTREHQWHRSLKALSQFVDDNGHLPSSRSGSISERHLATWVANQRRNQPPGAHLTKAQRKELDSVPGWFWSATKLRSKLGYTPSWKATYDELLEHLVDGGSMPTQTAEDPDVARLGRWIANQRRAYRVRHGVKSNLTLRPLTDEQIRLLGKIPMWTWPAVDKKASPAKKASPSKSANRSDKGAARKKSVAN